MKTATKPELSKYNIEYTDTFGGEANYSWVTRTTVEAPTLNSAIRKAKQFVGLTNHRCRRVCAASDFGAALKPANCCTILFVDLAY